MNNNISLRGTHILTSSDADRATLLADGYVDDGPGKPTSPLFFAPITEGPGNAAIRRFRRKSDGARFHPKNPNEAVLFQQSPLIEDEGKIFLVTGNITGATQLFQFVHPDGGGVFYTISEEERAVAIKSRTPIDIPEALDEFTPGGGYLEISDGEGNAVPLGFVFKEAGSDRVPIFRMFKRKPTLRLHIRVSDGDDRAINRQIEVLRKTLAGFGVTLEIGSDVRGLLRVAASIGIGECEAVAGIGIELPEHCPEPVPPPPLRDPALRRGTCDQKILFSSRDGAATGEMIAYFVLAANPPVDGCAAAPELMPSAIVTKNAHEITLAHEIGHLLGLEHTTDEDKSRLMHPAGTGTALSQAEIKLIFDLGMLY